MRRALVVGINNYPLGNELEGCVADAEQVSRILQTHENGDPNFGVKTLVDVQTSKELMLNIETLFSGNGECALLYFSGHGYVNTTGAEIVVPDNIQANGNHYMGIQMRDILDIANNSKINNKIIILDCCYSGNMGKYSPVDANSHLNTGVSILTACRDDESAMEAGGHGLFTELLCDALNGGAADFSGNITIGGVYAYIDRSFGAWEQRPVFKTNVTAFMPIRKMNPRIDINIIRDLTSLFPDYTKALPLNPSFEDTNDPNVDHHYVEPYAEKDNVIKFKKLQKLQSIGFVRPVDAEFMYFAAMQSKACELTPLGQYYWRLVKDGRI